MTTTQKHIPVLLGAVLDALGDINDKTIVDCTFGAGGYSRAFLARGANVIAFDRDPNVRADADAIAWEYGERFTFVPRTFSHIAELEAPVDAIVFDLGISSMQIDIAERGFSFRADAPLDMRMSADGMTALELIEQKSVAEIAQILRDWGDVKKAAVLARAIKDAMPQTTLALRDLIHNPRDVAPVFQALRIAVNDEMGELERALAAVPDLLVSGGKCICVTFHSLEDRIVKNFLRDAARECICPPDIPVCVCNNHAKFTMPVRGVISATEEELAANRRAASAKLRIADRTEWK